MNHKKTIIILLFFSSCLSLSAQVMHDSIGTEFIRTVQFSLAGSETQPPVLPLDGPQRLQLSFDELSDESHTFRYRITHCDANWRPDGLEPYQYLDGFEEGYINDFESSFTTLMPYMHYTCQLPATYTRFLLSGNYLLTITPEDNPTITATDTDNTTGHILNGTLYPSINRPTPCDNPTPTINPIIEPIKDIKTDSDKN